MVQEAFIGPVIHTDENGALIIIKRAGILIENGKINCVIIDPVVEDIVAQKINVLTPNQFIIPGFIDCHTHAVQFPNLGLGYDKYLLDWLEHYTFPLEKKYIDLEFANRALEAVVKQTIEAGTTTACYFASLYVKASIILAKQAAKLGQRVFIGKVNMNAKRDDNYYEETEASISNTIRFIEEIEKIQNPLIRPIITPRFALSCDMELMQALAKIARKNNLHIQSHISENKDEIKAVKERFKEYSSYAAVYDAAGLLTNKTILAHGVYLTDSELFLLKERQTAIIHCPSSNTCLKSGLCDVQKLKANKIKVGLGTDVAGGQSQSMLDAMKSALQVSNHISMVKDNYEPLNYKDVFHMATLGSATALSIDHKVGNFAPNKEFDALIIDLATDNSLLKELMQYTLEEKLQKFIYSGDDRNIIAVYVRGNKIK